MAAYRVWKHKVPQGVDLEPLDRISGRDGSRLVEADVTDIDVNVFLVPDKAAILTQAGLDPSAGVDADTRVFDTLQTDGRWTKDDTGYNFRHLITQAQLAAASAFLEGGKTYRVEVKFNTTSWGDLYTVHEYSIDPLWSVVS